MRTLHFPSLAAAVAVMAAAQAPVKVQSPDQQIEVSIAVPQSGPNAGWLTYEVSYRGKAVIAPSRMGLKLEGKPALGEKVTAIEPSATSGADTYELIHGKASRVRHEWRGTILRTESAGGRLEVEVRAYDDGVAFRYRLPEAAGSFAVEREHTQFQAAREGTGYPLILASFRTSYEDSYVALPLSSIKPASLVALPFTFEVPGAAWVSITEAHLENWAGMYLTRPARLTMEAKLAPRLDRPEVAVLGQAPAHSSWRVLIIAAEPYKLLESNLVTSLSPESRLGRPDWVKPGKTSWSWWSGNFAKDVSFKPGMNTDTLKHYIDFSAEAGLEYTLIDAGWSGGAVGQGGGGRDITIWNERVDVPALLEYARSKNVKVWLWTHWTAVDAQMEKAFPLFEKWGVVGVKIDFMDRDDQQMVDFYHRAARKAAEHKLMIDFHGAFKPSGMMRYYPNVLTHEGILGLEYLKWSNRCTADHNTMIPFTRLLAGPLDYTPGGFENVPASEFQPRNVNPTVPTTRAHQMALFVVLESAFQMLADYPGAYRGTKELAVLKEVPAAWDETRGLGGRPGEFATVARRKGQTWYVGTIGASQAREVEIPLGGILGAGSYAGEIWSDAPDAATNPKNTVTTTQTVTQASRLRARLAPAGGHVIVLRAGSATPAQAPLALTSPEVHSDKRVTFRFRAPNAREVLLAREGAPRIPMQKDEQGVWTVTTPPLEPDLYGYTFVADGVSLIDPLNPLMKPNLLNTQSVVHVPGPASLPWELNDVPRGRIHRHPYKSKVVGDDRDYYVYTPPGYDPRAKKLHPVLYLLHGFSDDARAWTDVGRAHVILDNLIAQGKAHPMLVVMPLGYGAPEIVSRTGPPLRDPNLRKRSYDKFREALFTEVLPQVERAYRVAADRNSRAIAGLSMGGAESLYVGLNALDRFAWIGAFSSGGMGQDFNAEFPGLDSKANAKLRLLWIGCGTEDRLMEGNRKLREWLKSRDIRHTAVETPGAHTWMVWRRYLADFVPLLFRP